MKMRGKRTASITAGVCALLAAAGCGGGGAENDYAEAYGAITGKIARELEPLQSAPTTDPARLRSQLRTMAAALGEASTEFAAIQPPADAKAGHAEVHAGVRALAADVRSSADALDDASSPAATLDALRTVTSSKGPAQIQAGERELRQAGYELRSTQKG